MKSIAIIGTGFSAATLSYLIKKDLDFTKNPEAQAGVVQLEELKMLAYLITVYNILKVQILNLKRC